MGENTSIEGQKTQLETNRSQNNAPLSNSHPVNPDSVEVQVPSWTLKFRISFVVMILLPASCVGAYFGTYKMEKWGDYESKDIRELLGFTLTALTTGAVGASAIYAARTLKQAEITQGRLLDEQIRSVDRQEVLSLHIHNEQLEEKRSDRALTLISFWEDPRHSSAKRTAKAIKEEVDKLNGVPAKEKRIRELFECKPEHKADITNLLNILENVALQIRIGIANEEILKKFFRGIFAGYYQTFQCYISDRRREIKNDKAFVNY